MRRGPRPVRRCVVLLLLSCFPPVRTRQCRRRIGTRTRLLKTALLCCNHSFSLFSRSPRNPNETGWRVFFDLFGILRDVCAILSATPVNQPKTNYSLNPPKTNYSLNQPKTNCTLKTSCPRRSCGVTSLRRRGATGVRSALFVAGPGDVTPRRRAPKNA